MLRHMLVTSLIVAVIYIGLLVIIDHPFVATAQSGDVKVRTAETQLVAESTNAAKTVETAKNAKSVKKDQAIHIYGLQKSINFNRATKDVNSAWQELLSNEVLINNVDWAKDNVKVYAYFHDFNSDMTQGQLAIGFDGNDLKLNTSLKSVRLPQGKTQKFKYEASAGTAEEDAWNAAYKYQNLIERHTLDSNGEIIASDVIVVQ